MIFRHYLSQLKRWAWLMVLGLALGALAGWYYAQSQPPVYEASARFMFIQAGGESNSTQFTFLNDKNVAATLSELMLARPVVDETSQRLGYRINPRRIQVGQVEDSRVLQVLVADNNSNRAADTANTLVDVFIDQQENMRSSLYASEEESLKQQIDQIQAQIEALQAKSIEEVQRLRDEQRSSLEAEIAKLQAEVDALQQEVVILEFGGTPVPGYDSSWRAVMNLPTLTVKEQVDMARKTNRLQEAQRLLSMYRSIEVDMNYRGSQASLQNPNSPTTLSLEQYQGIYSRLLENYEAVRAAKRKVSPDLVVVERANAPALPARPVPLVGGLVGMGLGLALALLAAVALIYTDEVIRTVEEARIILRLPVLASFTSDDFLRRPVKLSTGKKNGSQKGAARALALPPSGQLPVHEGMHLLHSNLQFLEDEHPLRTLLVSAPGDSDAGAQVAARLALAAAQRSQPVLLVDANLRTPQIARYLGIRETGGLGDVLLGGAALEKTIHPVDGGSLKILTSGRLPADPSGALNRRAVSSLLETLASLGGLVVISGPAFAFAEASVLAACVDGVMLTVELDHTRATAALSAMEQLYLSRANVIGMVLM